MEKQSRLMGISGPAWGLIAVMVLLILVLAAFLALDVGTHVF